MLKFSFILPCYNVAPYIGRCIESIEHQDIPQSEYEVICVDDCSKDDTVQKIKEYQAKYPNIQLICHEVNKTAGGARNTGMDAAKGEYLWFVDPDDMICTDVLKQLYERITSVKAELLFFNFYMSKESGERVKSDEMASTDGVVAGMPFVMQFAPKGLSKFTCIYNLLFERDFVNKHKIYYPEIRAGQDVVFIWSCILTASRCAVVDTLGYHYIRRGDSVTGSKGRFSAGAILSQSLLFASEIHKILLRNNNLDKEIMREIGLSISYALNTDSRNIIYAPIKEQHVFYLSLKHYKVTIGELCSYMNSKTKHIFASDTHYIIWQLYIWACRFVDVVKRRNSSLSYE